MKRKMLKKAAAFAMTAIMLAGGVSGTTVKVSAEESNAILDTSEEVNLVMYIISDRPAGQDVVDEHLNELLKEKLNCTLTIKWLGWAEYTNKYPLLFSSGEEFDMAYASTTWLNAVSMAQKGAFMELDDLWPTYAPINYERQSEGAKSLAMINDHYYMVPTLLATYSGYGPIYRTDLVEGTDWDGEMKTFEDVEEYCDLVKELHPEIEPIDQYAMAPEWSFLYMGSQGYSSVGSIRYLWFDTSAENPQVITNNDFADEGMTEFLGMMSRWNEKGFFSKSALADTDTQKTRNGKSALKIHNLDSFNEHAVAHPEWGFQYSNFTKDVSHIQFTTDSMAIPYCSRNPERAMALWDLITSDQEVFDAFYYGVEGVSYELNDKGEFKIMDPDLYSTSAMWAARTPEFNRNQVGSSEDYNKFKEEFEEHIKEGEGAERYIGFTFDSVNVETELAACNNVWQQYWWPLELGYTDYETGFAEYEEKMKAAGIDKVIEEAQRQLDEYVEAH